MHSLCKVFDNLHVLPSNFQIRGMHTVIRDIDTSRNKFVFMADRLNRIVRSVWAGGLRAALFARDLMPSRLRR